jgi:hypothetical protein
VRRWPPSLALLAFQRLISASALAARCSVAFSRCSICASRSSSDNGACALRMANKDVRKHPTQILFIGKPFIMNELNFLLMGKAHDDGQSNNTPAHRRRRVINDNALKFIPAARRRLQLMTPSRSRQITIIHGERHADIYGYSGRPRHH